MYIRTIKRKNKDGSVVEYVQLANNVWNKEKGFAQAQVIHSFGRSDQLDVDALRRLIKSISRFLDPEDAVRIERQSDDLKFVSSRPAGGASLLVHSGALYRCDRFGRWRCRWNFCGRPYQ
jgi:hypothetical protein